MNDTRSYSENYNEDVYTVLFLEHRIHKIHEMDMH